MRRLISRLLGFWHFAFGVGFAASVLELSPRKDFVAGWHSHQHLSDGLTWSRAIVGQGDGWKGPLHRQHCNTQEIIHWRGSNCPYQWRSDPVARSKSQRALWPARRSDTPIDKISREQTPHAQCAPCSSVRRHPRAMLKLGSRIQHSRACWELATDSQAVRRALRAAGTLQSINPSNFRVANSFCSITRAKWIFDW